jgi:flagellar motility protein MotE (MotC chaperone)
MKQPLLYIGIFSASLLMLFQIALVLLMVKPGLFLGKAAAENGAAGTVATPGGPDSAKNASAVKPPATTAKPPMQGAGAVSPGDSLQALRDQLVAARENIARLERQMKTDSATSGAESDTARMKEHKMKAKLLESMNPESAAHVLKNMDDGDVRSIIMLVKKRQAGKILAMFDPERAAKIMK